jgi:hypothetical protein
MDKGSRPALTVRQRVDLAAGAAVLVAFVIPAVVATAGIANDRSSTAGLRLLWWTAPILAGIALLHAVRGVRAADSSTRAHRFRTSETILVITVALVLYVRFD